MPDFVTGRNLLVKHTGITEFPNYLPHNANMKKEMSATNH